jgi:hypothetical protein
MQNRIAVALAAIIFAITMLAIIFWATGEKTVFAVATVNHAERMCVPYDIYRAGEHSRRIFPNGWTDSGRSCTDRAAIMNVRRAGFWYIDSYWIAEVSILQDGKVLSGNITTKNQPLVVFKSGESREPTATKGLKIKPMSWTRPTRLDGEKVEIGDSLQVSYLTTNPSVLSYAPNELVNTQYTSILLGCAIILGLMLLLFMPDGFQQTEEGKRYIQQMRERHWD